MEAITFYNNKEKGHSKSSEYFETHSQFYLVFDYLLYFCDLLCGGRFQTFPISSESQQLRYKQMARIIALFVPIVCS